MKPICINCDNSKAELIQKEDFTMFKDSPVIRLIWRCANCGMTIRDATRREIEANWREKTNWRTKYGE